VPPSVQKSIFTFNKEFFVLNQLSQTARLNFYFGALRIPFADCAGEGHKEEI